VIPVVPDFRVGSLQEIQVTDSGLCVPCVLELKLKMQAITRHDWGRVAEVVWTKIIIPRIGLVADNFILNYLVTKLPAVGRNGYLPNYIVRIDCPVTRIQDDINISNDSHFIV
jgi:hypothetical protein